MVAFVTEASSALAAAARAARDRSGAEGRRATADEASRGVRRGRSRRREHHGRVAARCSAAAPPAAEAARARHGPRARGHLRQGDARPPRGHSASSWPRHARRRAALGRRAALSRVPHAARQRAHGGVRAGMQLAAPLAEHLRRYFDSEHRHRRDAGSTPCERGRAQIEAMADALARWPQRASSTPRSLQGARAAGVSRAAPPAPAAAPPPPRRRAPRGRAAAEAALSSASGVRSRDRRDLRRGSRRDSRQLRGALQEVRQRQDAGCRRHAAALPAHAEGRRAHGGRAADGRLEPRARDVARTDRRRPQPGRRRPRSISCSAGSTSCSRCATRSTAGRAIAPRERAHRAARRLRGARRRGPVPTRRPRRVARRSLAARRQPLPAGRARRRGRAASGLAQPVAAEVAHDPTVDLTDADLQQLESIELGAPTSVPLADPRVAAEVIEEPTVEEPIAVDEALVAARRRRSSSSRPTLVVAAAAVEAPPAAVAAAVAPRRAAAPSRASASAERAETARVDAALARRAAERRRRDQHLPVAAEPAAALDRVPLGRARRHGFAAARAAAQARGRDRGADSASPSGRRGHRRRLRPARARPLLDDSAAVARAGGIRQRRREHQRAACTGSRTRPTRC